MDETIYFDENLFYLNEIINTIADGVRLDLETSLFSDKIVSDVLFVEHALTLLSDALIENELLIHRSDDLRRLLRTLRRFVEVLESITTHPKAFAARLQPFHEKLDDICEAQREHIGRVWDILSTANSSDAQPADVVSEAEIRFLLDGNSSEELA